MAAPAMAIGPAGPFWKPPELIESGLDFSSQVGSSRYLAFDNFGSPAVSYGPILRFAQRLPGGTWGKTLAGVQLATEIRGRTSLVFDRYERPMISYEAVDVGFAYNEIRFRSWNGSAWSAYQTLATETTGDSALVLDVYGQPVVALRRAPVGFDPYIEIFADPSGTGSLSQVAFSASATDSFFDLSLAVDDANRYHVASYGIANTDLELFSHNGLVGMKQVVDSGGGNDVGREASIAIHPDTGQPAISYSDQTTGDLKYAEWNESNNQWDITTINVSGSSAVDRAIYTSLAFDPSDNRPAIAYHLEGTSGGLGLA